MQRTYRVVVAQPGFDGVEPGAKNIARTLRDAGFEVVCTGPGQTPEQIIQAVIQEDADALGLSFDENQRSVVLRFLDLLSEHDRDDVLLLVDGMPSEDGVPSLDELSAWLENTLDERELQNG